MKAKMPLDEEGQRARRNLRLALAHVLLAFAILAVFVMAQVARS